MISVLRLLPIFSAFVILTSYLSMRPEADIRHVHELVKVERFSPSHKPVVKSEVKIKKSFEKCFWITTDKYLSELQHIHVLFADGTIVSKFQIAFGFTARPPPVSLT